MRTISAVILTSAVIGGCLLVAQTAPGFIGESKRGFDASRDNIQKMAEAMPEESYSFKPTPDIRAFGELMAHVADAQARICSSAAGAPKSVGAAQKKTKAEIVAALKESSAICDAAFDSLTDATAGQPGGMMNRTKLGLLQYNTGHTQEEYGYGSVYLRLKSIVPPSTAGRGR